jgi:hypothetical protein
MSLLLGITSLLLRESLLGRAIILLLNWSLPLDNISHCAIGVSHCPIELPLRNRSPEYEWDIPLRNGIAQ